MKHFNSNPTPPPRLDAKLFLTHAWWHCHFGSCTITREPDAADLVAITILKKALEEVSMTHQ